MRKFNYILKVSTSNLKSFLVLEKIINKVSSGIKITFLPTKQKRFVLLKSPHVNKKSKEHFQLLRHQRLYSISFYSETGIKELLLKIPNNLTIIVKKLV